MVALLHPTERHPAPHHRAAAPHHRASVPHHRASAPRPRHLRLVSTQTKTAVDPLSIVAVVAIIATLLLVVLVRGVQGAPPASDWQTLTEAPISIGAASSNAASSSAAAAPIETGRVTQTVTVVEGDTWATIAGRVQPGVDPVEFARSLASANDGYQLHVGQVLVIPAES